MASAAGQSINGWPHETADDAFGVSWGGTEAGFDALALAHTDLGLPLDEVTLANRRTAEQVVYKIASGTKGPRATSAGHLRETAHASVLVLSTGEKSLAQFIGPSLQEGARKRLVDVLRVGFLGDGDDLRQRQKRLAMSIEIHLDVVRANLDEIVDALGLIGQVLDRNEP